MVLYTGCFLAYRRLSVLCRIILSFDFGRTLYGQGALLFSAVVVILFSLWRIWCLQMPSVLVCQEYLLVRVSGMLSGNDIRQFLKPLYFVAEYQEIAGFSHQWDEMYLGTETAGGLVKVSVRLSHISRQDRERIADYIEKKQNYFCTDRKN